jgi:Barrel-sandwich domain of CusB or HlyD membrane-fusion
VSKAKPQIKLETTVTSTKRKDALGPFAEITNLARKASSVARFLSDATSCVVRAFSAPYGAIHARFGAEIVSHDAHTGPGDPKFWKATLHQFLTDSLTDPKPHARMLRARSGKGNLALLSAPIFAPGGSSIGAIAIVVAVKDEGEWTSKLASLESLCRFISATSEFVGQTSGGGASVGGGAIGEQGMSKAWVCDSAEQFAFSITNELRNKLGLEQVSLGIKHRSRAKILSISGLDKVVTKSPGVVALRSAMEECLDAGVPILFHRGAQWDEASEGPIYLLHKQWHGAANGDAVASIPLSYDGQTMAVLSLRSRADHPLSMEKINQIRKRVEPITPALLLARRATRGVGRHAVDTMQGSYDDLFSEGGVGRKIAVVVGIVAALFFAFGTMDYDLNVPCRVAPSELRHLSAPFAGRLAAAYVVAGDHVTEGQVLAELDVEELVQQQRELEAQWQVNERERDRALASGKPADAQIALANRNLVDTRLEIIKHRIAQGQIVAPFDGVVVEGDLRKLIGIVVAQGEPLYRLARPGRWKLEMEVPERAAADVQVDLHGSFASFADPRRLAPFRVVRVSPTAIVVRAKNVFIAEADVSSDELPLRPGMEGIARVRVGRRPIRWVTMHRILDYLYLHLWL